MTTNPLLPTAHACVPIGDYALIGNARTAALVARDGSIDWWCWPRFDSPAVFCRLLDLQNGGTFQIRPTEHFTTTRAYQDTTNVLVTTFETSQGRARVTDFLPYGTLASGGPETDRPIDSGIIRLVEGLSGEIDLAIRFRPTLDYARDPATVTPDPGGAIVQGQHLTAALRCPVPLEPTKDGSLVGNTRLSAGQKLWLAVTAGTDAASVAQPLNDADLEGLLSRTLASWTRWTSQFEYDGPYRDLVLRSALTLKMLSYEPSGSIIAAPTTSLPEEPGGVRNWDYRYTWIRDSALILEAMEAIGFHDEAVGFFNWLRTVWERHPGNLRIMYGLDGGPVPTEEILGGLTGHCGARPVRVGNAAADQTQLDVLGEVLDAAHFCHIGMAAPNPEYWYVFQTIANQTAARWREPDQGIWEIRGEPRQFLYSKLLCWVALDRAIKLGELQTPRPDLSYWEQEREAIRAAVLSEGFNLTKGAFTQTLNGSALDASALVVPIVGFLPASDWRVLSTIQKIRDELVSGGLVYRYRNGDGLPAGEAAFVICSFWLVDNLALSGQVDEARRAFEHIVGYANDVGLLSEEINPHTGELLGNFPQGFSHLALIRSALHIERAELLGPERHPRTRAERLLEVKHLRRRR